MSESGRIAENTITVMLTEKLKALGLNASFELQFSTSSGIKKPDITIDHDGVYFIEAKQRPQKLNDAVSKAYIYKQSLMSITKVNAVFALVFPRDSDGDFEAAVLLNESPFYSYCEPKPKNLDEMAKWIYNTIKFPIVAKSINTSHVIALLNNSVEDLTTSFQTLQLSEIDDIFGGKGFFESVLGFSEENQITAPYLRKGAAYLLLNQLLFYQILSRESRRFPILESELINHPSQLYYDYFMKVLEIDYKPIFDFNIASKITDEDAIYNIRKTIDAINALVPERHEHDILGKIFHNLIPLAIRKVVAAYYTNSEAAELLASIVLDDPNAEVIDPACGSGTLLVAAYRRKKFLLQQLKKEFTLEIHRQFVENDITGIDIMPFAAHLAAVHLALQSPLYNTDKVRISIADSTRVYPNFTIAPAQNALKEVFKDTQITDFFGSKTSDDKRKRISAGVVKLVNENSSMMLHYEDLVMMNPPFTRRERLIESYRKHLLSQFTDYKKYIYGKLGLHGFFIFRADSFLKKNGRMALVLPASILRVQTTEGIRKFLIENYDLEYILTTEQRSAFSEDANFREILLIAKKVKHLNRGTASPKSHCTVVVLKKIPSDLVAASILGEEIKDIANKMAPDDTIDLETMTIFKLTHKELEESTSNLFKFIAISDPRVVKTWETIQNRVKGKIKKFNQCYKKENKIGLGIEMNTSVIPVKFSYILRNPVGKLKSVDKWVVNDIRNESIIAIDRFSHMRVSIPIKSLRFGLRRSSGLSRMDVTDDLDFVISERFNEIKSIFEDKNDEFQRKLPKWNKELSTNACNLVISRRFNISAPGTKHLAFFSDSYFTPTRMMWAIKDLTNYDAKIMALWFNSTLYLTEILINRIETEGAFLDFSKYMLEDSAILDLHSLTDSQKNKLLTTFDEVSKIQFPSILEQLENKFHGRIKIDLAIMNVLGFNEKESKDVLSKMYVALAREITKLKQMMAGEGNLEDDV